MAGNLHQLHAQQVVMGKSAVSFRNPAVCSYCWNSGLTKYVSSGEHSYCHQCAEKLRAEYGKPKKYPGAIMGRMYPHTMYPEVNFSIKLDDLSDSPNVISRL